MRIGLNTNPSAGGGRPATLDQMIEQVARLADQGFDTAAFAQISGFDVLTEIAVIGRQVPRIEFETAVVPIYGRHPIALAQQALTTQAATHGRLVLGLGLSHKPVVEQRWGLSFERPAEYMAEYLQVLLPLLRGEAVEYAGGRIKANTQLSIAQAEQPPSVVLAALGERMLRLAGEYTDGTALWMVGPKTLESHILPVITQAAKQAGRPQPRIFVGLPICITNDVAAARERAARALANYNQLPSYRAMLDREGADGPADLLLAGSESDVERALERLEQAGATDFTAAPLGSRDEQLRTIDFLQAQVAHGRSTPV
jgi:5,10-methylenetetrahydromethanopterin reductase